jgi:hypothetical protein
MNERIKQLALQAGAKLGPYVHEVDLLQPDGTYKWDEERHTDTTTIDLEKFAELIVKECAEIAFQFSMENKRIHPNIDPTTMPEANQSVYHSTCQAVGYEIREHFGVEE